MLPKRLIYQSDLASVPENRTMSLPSHSGLYCMGIINSCAVAHYFPIGIEMKPQVSTVTSLNTNLV